MNSINLKQDQGLFESLDARKAACDRITETIAPPNKDKYCLLTTYFMIKDWKFPDLDFWRAEGEESSFSRYIKDLVVPSFVQEKERKFYVQRVYNIIQGDFKRWLRVGSLNRAVNTLKIYKCLSADESKRAIEEIEKIKELYQSSVQPSSQVIPISTSISESSNSESSSSNCLPNSAQAPIQAALSSSNLSSKNLRDRSPNSSGFFAAFSSVSSDRSKSKRRKTNENEDRSLSQVTMLSSLQSPLASLPSLDGFLGNSEQQSSQDIAITTTVPESSITQSLLPINPQSEFSEDFLEILNYPDPLLKSEGLNESES